MDKHGYIQLCDRFTKYASSVIDRFVSVVLVVCTVSVTRALSSGEIDECWCG